MNLVQLTTRDEAQKGVFPHWDIIPTVRFSFYVSQTETVCVLMFIRTETVSVLRCFGNQQRGKIRVIKGDGSDIDLKNEMNSDL